MRQIKKCAWLKHGPILSGCDGAYTCAPSTGKKAISTHIVRSRMVSRTNVWQEPPRRLILPEASEALFQMFQHCCTNEIARFASSFSYRTIDMDIYVSMCGPRMEAKHAPINHVRPASTSDVFSSISFPYKHKPGSKRKLSRAPRPASWTGDLARRRDTSTVWTSVHRQRYVDRIYI
jgi:hypothetical protein